jgi:hypothetical protein
VFFSKSKPAADVLATAPIPERRRSIRNATVMQLAKIRLAPGREELCLLRDVSPEGVKAEIYVRTEVGASVEIELRTGHTIRGRIAWIENALVGVAFDEPMPMAAMLAHCSFDDRLGKLRSPRLVVDMHGLLTIDFQQRVVRIGNISQSGLQIAANQPLDAGAPCAIALPGLAPRPATVRWCREQQAGLLLDEPFEYAAFAEWRAAIAPA